MFKIDKEFKELIPPLTEEERNQLEENCKGYGIRDALIVAVFPGSDGEVLIDGHNRYEIAQKCNLSFTEKRLDFASREDAKAFVIKNQLGRRNLPAFVVTELGLMLKSAIAEEAKLRKLSGKSDPRKNSTQGKTLEKIAQIAGVSYDTVRKVEKIQQKAPEETKAALRRGDISINQVYSGIMADEHEDRRKQEARELREAKERVENYQATTGKIADFGAAKQHKEDNALIFNEFSDELRKFYMGVLHISEMLEKETTLKAIGAADRREVIKAEEKLQQCYRFILKAQRQLVEVLEDEK